MDSVDDGVTVLQFHLLKQLLDLGCVVSGQFGGSEINFINTGQVTLWSSFFRHFEMLARLTQIANGYW
ncbi:MAG: hypothetical protein ACK521_10735 [bacterium]